LKIAVRKSDVLKTGLLIVAACFVSTPAATSSQVSLSNQSAAPGTSVLIPVVFASQGDSISGFQFDLQYDNAALSLSATLADSARNAEKSLYVADMAPNKKRFVIVGLNQNLINDGTLINFFANLNQSVAGGVYAFELSNLAATDPYGNPISIAGTDGIVSVQGTESQGERLRQQGVLNGASLVSGAVAPGEIITLIGSGIGPASTQQPIGSPSTTVLSGTSVFFDGTPAPLLYAAPNQINAIVPFAMFGKSMTQLQITSQGQMIAGLPLPATATVPAIFTLDSTGVGPGAILNEDSTVNSPSNPADQGSVVSVFATGAGQTSPSGLDGQLTGAILPSPLLPVSARMGGVDAQVLYAGAAPDLIAGVIQVNCVIPADAPSGPTVPIVLTIGPSSSQNGVTLAIK
jgi:uncharacterized protein (TIGR03437 family)